MTTTIELDRVLRIGYEIAEWYLGAVDAPSVRDASSDAEQASAFAAELAARSPRLLTAARLVERTSALLKTEAEAGRIDPEAPAVQAIQTLATTYAALAAGIQPHKEGTQR